MVKVLKFQWVRRWALPFGAFALPVIVVGAVLVVNRGSDESVAARSSGPVSSVDSFAVTAVSIPAEAPKPPATKLTSYCDVDPSHRAAVDAVRRALTLHQSFTVARDLKDLSDASAVRTDLSKSLDRSIGSTFSGKFANERKSFYSDLISRIRSGGMISLGGGVSALKCGSVSESGSQLTVTATATVWAIVESIDQSGVPSFGNPLSDMEVVATVDGSNRLTSMDIDFAEGFHP